MRSNQVCKSLQIADNDISFTLPTSGDASSIQSWADRYGINLNIQTVEAQGDQVPGTFTFSDSERTYQNGTIITKKQSELRDWQLTVTFITAKQIIISTDVTEVRPGDTFKINVNESDVKWNITPSGSINIDENGNVTVIAGEAQSVTVFASKGDNNSNTITINIVVDSPE